MPTLRSTLTRRLTAALEATPARIPVLLGGCGAGRTTLLQQLRERLGRQASQYVDVEHAATTPERFLKALASSAPVPLADGVMGPRAAFDAAMAFFTRARTAGQEPITFLLDEFLELQIGRAHV